MNRRLLPLPTKSADEKKPESRDNADETGAPKERLNHKAELQSLKSELQGLEQEELEHHHTNLMLAQERLRQRKKSDLAKRMQEAQRLQMLREKKAELDDTKKDKLIAFKQRMIAAAEKQLERESTRLDVLYENIGESLAAQEVLLNDGLDFMARCSERQSDVQVDDDRTTTVEDNDAMPSYGGQVRLQSSFEEHLLKEQQRYRDQLRALRIVHGAPQAVPVTTPRGQRLPPISQDTLKQHQSMLLSERAESAQLTKGSSGLVKNFLTGFSQRESAGTPPSSIAESSCALPLEGSGPVVHNKAREEHLKLREEMRRLISQGAEALTELSLLDEQPPREGPHDTKRQSSSARGAAAYATKEPDILNKVKSLERREEALAREEAFLSKSVVPFEDTVRNGVVIQENAEANYQQLRAAEKAALDKLERERASEIRSVRSASMFSSVRLDEDNKGKVAAVKSKRVSMLQGQDDLSSPLTAAIASAGSGPSANETSPLTFDLERSKVSSGSKRSASLLLRVDQDEKQLQLIEQQQARYMSKRASQKEDLKSMQKKLAELMEAEEKDAKEKARKELETQVASAITSEVLMYAMSNVPPLEDVRQDTDSQVRTTETDQVVPLPPTDDPSPQNDSAPSSDNRTKAAIVIQCMYRSWKSRQVTNRRRNSYKAHLRARAVQIVAEESRLSDIYSVRLVMLQEEAEVLRSLKAREAVFDERTALIAISSRELTLLETREADTMTQRRAAAANRIQTIVRGHQARVWYAAVKVERRNVMLALRSAAASRIQDWVRAVLVRRRAFAVHHPRASLKRRYDMSIESGGFKHIAATAIQCFFRHIRTRAVCRRKRLEEAQAVLNGKRHDASVMLQKVWRGYAVRTKTQRELVSRLIHEASTVAAVLRTIHSTVDASVAESAAVTIGKYVRRSIARVELRKRWTERVLEDAIIAASSCRDDSADE